MDPRPAQRFPGDEELVRRICDRDESALTLVIRKHSGRVYGTAFRVLRRGPEAQEVAQDVFWALWQAPQRFDGCKGRLPTWLNIVSRSRALDLLRSIRASAKRLTELSSSAIRTGGAYTFNADRELIVEELLGRLPDEQSTVMWKFYFEGYAFREIATSQEVSVGTVKGRARFAIKKLRGEML